MRAPDLAQRNPIVTEIIRNALIAATEDMKATLTRTAYNVIIYEHLDFTVGLFNPAGETISVGLGLPSFIRGMSHTVQSMNAVFPEETLEPGDVLVTNDPWITGSHKNHITLSRPIFWEDEVVAYACCMAHWQDIGGSIHAVTTDIFSEGLEVPVSKLVRAGRTNEDLVSLLSKNVRNPHRALGDLRAQLGSVAVGERRVIEMVQRFGKATVHASIEELMQQSDQRARARLRKIPPGTYSAELFMDDDGVTLEKRIPIRVKVVVDEDSMTVDLSEVSDQVQGFYNSSAPTGRGCAQVAFKCLTSADDFPINDGSFRALKVILPEGKVVSARRPAAMRYWMTIPMTIVDTIFKALAPAIPDKVIAGHHADLILAQITGSPDKTGRSFFYTAGMIGGGWGAKSAEDGVSATVCINDGDTHNGPIEQLETKFPFRVEAYRLRTDSGGAGKYRGGLGTEFICTVLEPITFSSSVERVHCRPWGIEGGDDAAGNSVSIRQEKVERGHVNGKIRGAKLEPGDAYILRSGGGGGFGDPHERDRDAILDDVREGYISKQAAEQKYGIDPSSDGKKVVQKAAAPV